MGEGATTGETTDGSSHKSHRGKRKDASGDSATSSYVIVCLYFARAALCGNSRVRRKKRRFVWPDGLHVKFVSAVFDVGLRCSSAQTIVSLFDSFFSEIRRV